MGDASSSEERQGAEGRARARDRWAAAVPWVLAAAFVGLVMGAIVVGSWSTLGL